MRPDPKCPATPSCDEIRPLLPDLLGLDGRTTALPAIRTHLEACPDCREELAAWQSLRGALHEAWPEARPPAFEFAMAAVPAELPGRRSAWMLRAMALLPEAPPRLEGLLGRRPAWIAMPARFATALAALALGLSAALLGLALWAAGGSLRQAWLEVNAPSPAPDAAAVRIEASAPRPQAGGPVQATPVLRSTSVAGSDMASVEEPARARSSERPDGNRSVASPPESPDPVQNARPAPGASTSTPATPRTIHDPASPQAPGSQAPPAPPRQPDEPREPEDPSEPDHPPEPTSAPVTSTPVSGPATPQPTAVARVAGRVEDSAGLGLAWALVYLRPWPVGEGRFLLTDTAADGSFVLDLPAGSYRLWVEAEGYEPAWYGGEVADVIDLPPAAERRDLTVRLDPAGRPRIALPAPSPTAVTLPLPIPAPER